jgi:hypothetical protein
VSTTHLTLGMDHPQFCEFRRRVVRKCHAIRQHTQPRRDENMRNAKTCDSITGHDVVIRDEASRSGDLEGHVAHMLRQLAQENSRWWRFIRGAYMTARVLGSYTNSAELRHTASGIQFPWKPRGTRTGNSMTA